MGQLRAQNIERRRQYDSCAGAIVAAQASFLVRADDVLALPHGARTDADGHGVYVGREHPPRAANGARQLENEIADLPFEWHAAVCVIGHQRPGGNTGLLQLAANVIHDGRFLAAATGNGHHFHDHFQSCGIGYGFIGDTCGHLGRAHLFAVD
jgi:hypothetical protein